MKPCRTRGKIVECEIDALVEEHRSRWRWMLLAAAAGITGGVLVWLVVKAMRSSGSGSGLVFNNSTVTFNMSGQNRPIADLSGLRDLEADVSRIVDVPAVQRTPRWDGSLLTSHPEGFTVGTAARRIVGKRFRDCKVTVTNSSAANTVRIGTEGDVRAGGGMPLPPNGVMDFQLWAGTDLWAQAAANVQVGVLTTEVA